MMLNTLLLLALMITYWNVHHVSGLQFLKTDGTMKTGSAFELRQKRAGKIIGLPIFVGKTAITKLLRRSTFAYSEDGAINYVKSGGYQAAINDFLSVNPTDVKTFQKAFVGDIGDRKLVVLPSGDMVISPSPNYESDYIRILYKK